MSPNLFKKYYAAGQQVADHVLLTTTGFEFAPYPVVTFSDQQKFYEQAILRFYEQHKINYEAYLTAAWSYRHRPASRRDVTIEAWAAENKLSQKYLRSLWDALQDDAASNVFYIQWLRQRWNALPAPTERRQPLFPPKHSGSFERWLAIFNDLSQMLCMPETPGDHLQRRQCTYPAHRSSQENGGRPRQIQPVPDAAAEPTAPLGTQEQPRQIRGET